jgi:hypothetical protein
VKIKKIKPIIINTLKPRIKGGYIEILIYSSTIFLYSIFNNKFVSWWGIGLNIIQIRIILIISLCISIIMIYKLHFGLYSIKNNTLKYKVYHLIIKTISIWIVIIALFIFQIYIQLRIFNYVIVFIMILFVLYLENVKNKINMLVNNKVNP